LRPTAGEEDIQRLQAACRPLGWALEKTIVPNSDEKAGVKAKNLSKPPPLNISHDSRGKNGTKHVGVLRWRASTEVVRKLGAGKKKKSGAHANE